MADLRYDYSQTIEQPAAALEAEVIASTLEKHLIAGSTQLAQTRHEVGEPKASYAARMCYRGQIHTLRVAIEANWKGAQIADAFEAAYEAEFGSRLEDVPPVVVALETTVFASHEFLDSSSDQPEMPRKAEATAWRDVFFEDWSKTAIFDRSELCPGMYFDGPAVIEQADATTIVEPGMTARVDSFGNLLIEMSE